MKTQKVIESEYNISSALVTFCLVIQKAVRLTGESFLLRYAFVSRKAALLCLASNFRDAR
jgi:hypothetical protein